MTSEPAARFWCAANFSEGRRADVIEEIAAAIRAVPGATLADNSGDPDHNRSVLTFIGEAAAIQAAGLAAARVAVARIDLRRHTGAHPRAGALDVLPIVPLAGATRAQAVALAHTVGGALAQTLALPVYFYEWAALPGCESALPMLRRGGFERRQWPPPDCGPVPPHPSAGVTLVGARGPLVAYNVLLDTPDVEIARAIARRIRQERSTRPELEGARALGFYLPSRNRAQVSLNLTRPERTALPGVFAYVQTAARALGAEAVESEIIGLIPTAALGGLPPEAILWPHFHPNRLLETWLNRSNPARR